MAMTEAQEANLSNAVNKRQDKEIPFLICTDDARLMPNVPQIRKMKNYMPYHGSPSDDLATRKAFLQGMGGKRRIVNSAPDEVFDVGTASVEELAAFAMDEFGFALDVTLPAKKLRTKVMELARLSEGRGSAVDAARALAKEKGVGLNLTE
jgi:hypothetical protein